MKTRSQSHNHLLQEPKVLHPAVVAAIVGVGILAATGVWAADAAADRLFADAKAKETQAQKLRADAAAKLQEAADEEMAASNAERESRVLNLKALQTLKADANQQKAFMLRHEARGLWVTAHRKLVDARNAEEKAAQHKHNAQEMLKAAAELKDQPAVATALENDAKAQTTEAENEAKAATGDKNLAQILDGRAAALWADAEKLAPERPGQLAAKPEKPVIRPAAPR